MHWNTFMTQLTVWKLSALLSVLFFAGACSDWPAGQDDGASDEFINKGITVEMPAGFAGLRAVVVDNLYAVLRIDGYNEKRFGPNDPLIVAYKIARGDRFTGTLQWFEALPDSGVQLLLASFSINQEVNGSFTLNIPSTAYNTEDAPEFDNDSDGVSNLDERRQDTDPLKAETGGPGPGPGPGPEAALDVRIKRIDPRDAPDIDGGYDAVYDSGATFQDERGENLDIDNLMIDAGALPLDEGSGFRWWATHDGSFMYVYVLGTKVGRASPTRDSTEFFQDDSIDIYIDADNSKGDTYDGIDDRQMIIPLLARPDNSSDSNTTAIRQGPNSASLPTVVFATCVCENGELTWEVKIPLSAFGIEVDRPFGFEVAVNIDNDGGRRDAKYGWNSPARSSEDADNTFKNPSFMGTAVIN